MTQKYYAHSLERKPSSEWQPLDEHLKNVAEMARSFAESFGTGDWAYMAGLKKRPFAGASGQRCYRRWCLIDPDVINMKALKSRFGPDSWAGVHGISDNEIG